MSASFKGLVKTFGSATGLAEKLAHLKFSSLVNMEDFKGAQLDLRWIDGHEDSGVFFAAEDVGALDKALKAASGAGSKLNTRSQWILGKVKEAIETGEPPQFDERQPRQPA